MNGNWNQFISSGKGIGADGAYAYVTVTTQPTDEYAWAYYKTPLCSANHEVTITDIQSNQDNQNSIWRLQGRAASYDGSTNPDRYMLDYTHHTAASPFVLRKVVATTWTALDSSVETYANGQAIALRVNGENLSGKLSGVEKVSDTDSDITTGAYCGINLVQFADSNGKYTKCSSFAAEII